MKMVLEQLYSLDAIYDDGVAAWIAHELCNGPMLGAVLATNAHWTALATGELENEMDAVAAALGISEKYARAAEIWLAMPAKLRGQYEAIQAAIVELEKA